MLAFAIDKPTSSSAGIICEADCDFADLETALSAPSFFVMDLDLELLDFLDLDDPLLPPSFFSLDLEVLDLDTLSLDLEVLDLDVLAPPCLSLDLEALDLFLDLDLDLRPAASAMVVM